VARSCHTAARACSTCQASQLGISPLMNSPPLKPWLVMGLAPAPGRNSPAVKHACLQHQHQGHWLAHCPRHHHEQQHDPTCCPSLAAHAAPLGLAARVTRLQRTSGNVQRSDGTVPQQRLSSTTRHMGQHGSQHTRLQATSVHHKAMLYGLRCTQIATPAPWLHHRTTGSCCNAFRAGRCCDVRPPRCIRALQ
jgi:hypothetical protein